jgi:hypothetical protein
MTAMRDDHVRLTTATGPVEASAIEAVLQEAGIPFMTQELDALTVLTMAPVPMQNLEFRVPSGRLEEARELLCANDIVCEVSERLLHRTFEEVVRPLLGAREPDLNRLLYLVGINNKDTLRALFERTHRVEGGLDLLEDLFFAMAREESSRLLVLARHLAGGMTAGFASRFVREAETGPKAARLSLLGVLPEFRKETWRIQALAPSLLDGDAEVRDAASEALFAIRGTDFGYDPEADPREREEALERILRAEGAGGA